MAVTAVNSPVAKLQFTDDEGNFLAGGQLFTYAVGTTTKTTTYQDADMSTPNTNPIVLDGEGRCTIFLPPGQFYKFVLAPADDTDPPTDAIWTVDGVGVASPKIPYAVATGAASAMAATVVGAPPTLEAGVQVMIQANATASGASTLTVTPQGGSSYGTITIKDKAGADIGSSGYVSGQIMLLTYDGTYWRTLF